MGLKNWAFENFEIRLGEVGTLDRKASLAVFVVGSIDDGLLLLQCSTNDSIEVGLEHRARVSISHFGCNSPEIEAKLAPNQYKIKLELK